MFEKRQDTHRSHAGRCGRRRRRRAERRRARGRPPPAAGRRRCHAPQATTRDRRGPLGRLRLGRRRPRRRRDAVAAGRRRRRRCSSRGARAPPSPDGCPRRARAGSPSIVSTNRIAAAVLSRRHSSRARSKPSASSAAPASRSASVAKCARWAVSSGSRSASRRVRKSSLSISSERASRTWATGWRSQRVTARLPLGVASRTVRCGPERLGTVPAGRTRSIPVRVSMAR